MNQYDEMKKSLTTYDGKFVQSWIDICEEWKQEEERWVSKLKEEWFKASHPNDWWVNRKENYVILQYPQFDDGVEVGNLIMLWWAHDKPSKNRPVKVTSIKYGSMGLEYFYFDDI